MRAEAGKALFDEWSGGSYVWEVLTEVEKLRWHRLAARHADQVTRLEKMCEESDTRLLAALNSPRSETEGREPVWIVNDSGELGVKLGNRLFFLYKGDNIEYKDGRHDDGTPMLYRRVGKREFGETQWPARWLREGKREDRYTEECRAGINSLPDVSHEYEWREFPALAHEQEAGE